MISSHSRDRLFEWIAASAMVGIGTHSAMFPVALEQSRISPILDLIWPPLFSVLWLFVGIIRILGLYFAKLPYRYDVRAIGAMIAASGWLWLALALIISAHELHISASPVIWLYAAMGTGDLISVYRARNDGNASKP